MDEVDLRQQKEIVDLQARDLAQARQLADMDAIVSKMRARMWVDVCATLVLVALNVAVLAYSVDINVVVLPK